MKCDICNLDMFLCCPKCGWKGVSPREPHKDEVLANYLKRKEAK
jgi:hypothetical protein